MNPLQFGDNHVCGKSGIDLFWILVYVKSLVASESSLLLLLFHGKAQKVIFYMGHPHPPVSRLVREIGHRIKCAAIHVTLGL